MSGILELRATKWYLPFVSFRIIFELDSQAKYGCCLEWGSWQYSTYNNTIYKDNALLTTHNGNIDLFSKKIEKYIFFKLDGIVIEIF